MTAATYQTPESPLMAPESGSQPVPLQPPPNAPSCPHPTEGGPPHTACALGGIDTQPERQQKHLDVEFFVDNIVAHIVYGFIHLPFIS